jgi:hypothetical protein
MILKKSLIKEKNKNKNKNFPLLHQKRKMKMFSNKNVNKIVKNCEVQKKIVVIVQIYEF